MSPRCERARFLSLRRRFAQAVLQVALPVLVKLDLRSETMIPPGPLLVAANHLSHLDPLPLIAHLDPPPEIAALSDLWHSPIAPFVRLYAPIPVQRERVDRTVIERVLAALANRERVIIFPEARISRSGELEPARTGIGYLALKAGVPVLPVAVSGTERALEAWRAFRRVRVRVAIGAPLHLDHIPRPRQADRASATAAIMHRIAILLPSAYRGAYSTAADGL